MHNPGRSRCGRNALPEADDFLPAPRGAGAARRDPRWDVGEHDAAGARIRWLERKARWRSELAARLNAPRED